MSYWQCILIKETLTDYYHNYNSNYNYHYYHHQSCYAPDVPCKRGVKNIVVKR